METYSFTIQGRLDGLNDYTKENRRNRYAGNKMKHKNELKVQEGIIQGFKDKTLKNVSDYPISLHIAWYEPNRRRDIDNITFATKFILDSLTSYGVIIDDSQKFINSISHDVLVSKDNPRIEVSIYG